MTADHAPTASVSVSVPVGIVQPRSAGMRTPRSPRQQTPMNGPRTGGGKPAKRVEGSHPLAGSNPATSAAPTPTGRSDRGPARRASGLSCHRPRPSTEVRRPSQPPHAESRHVEHADICRARLAAEPNPAATSSRFSRTAKPQMGSQAMHHGPMPPPTKQQVEVKVHEVVAQVLSSGGVEDDLVECKSKWPEPEAVARQLAGMANKSTPDPMTWIIGIDERARRLTTPQAVEISNWTAKLEKRFDGATPALLHHLNVTLASGEHVTALTFETDRAPYVVTTTGQGPAEREVPYRSGTGTRSAKRAELLRMLAPSIDVPGVVILDASFTIEHKEKPDAAAKINVSGGAKIFVEFLSNITAMIPNHTMAGTIRCGDGELSIEVKAWNPRWSWPSREPEPPPGLGVSETKDGLMITAPGSGNLHYRPQGSFDPDSYDSWITTRDLELDLRLGVTGASRDIHVRTRLRRQPIKESKSHNAVRDVTVQWQLQG